PPEDTADPVLDRTTRASMADMVKLGSLLARDQAAHPEACSMVRTLMGRQVWTHRFAAAFPSDRWTRNTKTGTLSPWRGEFGIVTRDDGVKLVLAVMLRQHDTGTSDAVADDAVADAARSAAALVMGGEVSGLYAADQAT